MRQTEKALDAAFRHLLERGRDVGGHRGPPAEKSVSHNQPELKGMGFVFSHIAGDSASGRSCETVIETNTEEARIVNHLTAKNERGSDGTNS